MNININLRPTKKRLKENTRRYPLLPMALVTVFALSGCAKKEEVVDVRPVRSMMIKEQKLGDAIVLTGQLHARDEVSLAFRLSGKLFTRAVNVGDTVKSGQIVATLDSENEKNAKNAAEADRAAAQAVLEQAEASEKRIGALLEEKAVSRAEYESALRQLKTAQAQVNSANAKLSSAEDQLAYTELKALADGVITQKGAEPREVVQAGQMILLLAQQDGRDAVFDMPAQIIRKGLSTQQEVEVWLADNPDIRTTGKIREVSPQADPATRTYQVKVGLRNAPASMFLGSTVVGRLILSSDMQIEIPSSALCISEGKPSVWEIDPTEKVVHVRPVTISRYAQDSIIVADGLKSGERIVTAGVQEIHEGQKIKLLEDVK